MKNQNIKIFYDKASEVLSLEMQRKKSVDSEIRDNVVIDYDQDGKVVRVNFYNFNFRDFRENKKGLASFSRHQKIPLTVS